jgi:hypothetical protein
MTLPSFRDRVAVHTHLSAKRGIPLRPISTLPSLFSGDGLEVMLPDGFRRVFPPPADNVLLTDSHLIGNPRRGLIPVHEVPGVFHFAGFPVFVDSKFHGVSEIFEEHNKSRLVNRRERLSANRSPAAAVPALDRSAENKVP